MDKIDLKIKCDRFEVLLKLLLQALKAMQDSTASF